MMTSSLTYLLYWFFYRIIDFLRNWYIGGLRKIGHRLIDALEILDRRVALRITFRNLFKPLYQDYTLLGYLFGFFFRFWRLIFGATLYFFVFLFFLAVFLAWGGVPIYIIYRGFKGW